MFDIFVDEKEVDKYLYHYTSMENALMYILPQKRIRFSIGNKTNDPKEVYQRGFQVFGDLKGEENQEVAMDFLMNNKKTKELSDEITNDIKVLCLAQDTLENSMGDPRIGRGFIKPRMWAQYAKENTGVCLIFNKKLIIKKFNESYKHYYRLNGSIDYSNTPEKAKRDMYAYSIYTSELKDLSIKELAKKRIEEYSDIYYFSKHPDWREENEYRMIVRYPDEEFAYLDIDGCLEGIVIGLNADESIKLPINVLLNNFSNKPRVAKMIYTNNQYMAVELKV